jgi:hypothetical protein
MLSPPELRNSGKSLREKPLSLNTQNSGKIGRKYALKAQNRGVARSSQTALQQARAILH